MIVRSDLPLGFLAAQLVHAAAESLPGPIPRETHAVVLAVPSEAALLAIAQRLARAELPHHLVREPDAPWLGQATAIGVAPAPRSRGRRVLSDVPLLRGREAG